MKFSTARKLWRLLTPPERRGAVVLLILMLIGMTLEALGVGLVIPAIAVLTQPDYAANFPALGRLVAAAGNPGQATLVAGGLLAIVLIYLIKSSFLGYLIWRQTGFAYGVQAQLSKRLFSLYLRQPYTFHLQHNSAELLRNVTGEVHMFTTHAMLPGLTFLSELFVLAGLCVLLLIIEPVGALIVLGVLGGASWGFHRLTRKRLSFWGGQRQLHEGLRIQHLQQGLGGVKDVKLLGRETEFRDQYDTHNRKTARAEQIQSALQQAPRLWLELLAVVGLAALVLSMIAQGRPVDLVLPTLGVFAAAAFRLMPSANRVFISIQALRYGLPVIDTLDAEMRLAQPAASVVSPDTKPFQKSIRLESVGYTYPGASAESLKSVSLAVERGEAVGFIGTSGAGKSTLVDVLLGLLTPQRGRVVVDGEDIRNNPRGWQDQIGYVSQSIYLTDDSIRRNVAFGLANEHIDDDAVIRALRAAQLEEFVGTLPDGVETLVGERGVRLSGGQRQRIGIARALYHDPSVLVLDEATSALDVETEKGVMESVRALHGSKTIVIVAHRFGTVMHCDRVFRLDKGMIAAEGRPDAGFALDGTLRSGVSA